MKRTTKKLKLNASRIRVLTPDEVLLVAGGYRCALSTSCDPSEGPASRCYTECPVTGC